MAVSSRTAETEGDPPEGAYVLLAMFPYYNNLFGVRLRRKGFVTRACTTIPAAFEQMERARPGLIIALVGNSTPRGLDLVREMKARPDLASLPVLGIAEEKQGHRVPEALALGMEACFAVPFDPTLLEDYVTRILAPEQRDPARQIDGSDRF